MSNLERLILVMSSSNPSQLAHQTAFLFFSIVKRVSYVIWRVGSGKVNFEVTKWFLRKLYLRKSGKVSLLSFSEWLSSNLGPEAKLVLAWQTLSLVTTSSRIGSGNNVFRSMQIRIDAVSIRRLTGQAWMDSAGLAVKPTSLWRRRRSLGEELETNSR